MTSAPSGNLNAIGRPGGSDAVAFGNAITWSLSMAPDFGQRGGPRESPRLEMAETAYPYESRHRTGRLRTGADTWICAVIASSSKKGERKSHGASKQLAVYRATRTGSRLEGV